MVHDIDISANDLIHDLEKTSESAFPWEMKFNPDSTKQTQEIIFSRKKSDSIHPVAYSNNTPVNSTTTCKHLDTTL